MTQIAPRRAPDHASAASAASPALPHAAGAGLLRPRALSVHRRQRAALALILAVAFMVVLDFSIVNVALASIERELHAGTTAVQWVITAYAITFGGLLVLGGRIADLFGRRRMFVTGLVLFSLASLAGGLATSIAVLVFARAVQGIGAAIVAPAALSLITTGTPEGGARNRALGYYGAVASIGFVAGLVFGGVLVQYFDWRSVLWVNVPIGLLAAALAPFLISESPREVRHGRLDVGGAVLVTGAIASLVFGISEGADLGWASSTTLGALALSLLLGAGFVYVERRHPAPLVRLGMLRRRGLRSANAAMTLVGAWSAGELLTVPLFFQLVLHYSALTTGLAMAPQGVMGFVAASRGASIVRRVGVRTLLVMSTGAAALGLALLGLSFGSHDYVLFLPGFMLAGFGTAASAFGVTVAATQGVDDAEQGLAGGLVNMTRQVGAAIGVALTAAIIGTGATPGGSVAPDRTSLFVIAAFGLVAAVVVGRGIARPTAVTSPAVPTPTSTPATTPERVTTQPAPAPAMARPVVRHLGAPRYRSAVRAYRAAICRAHRRRGRHRWMGELSAHGLTAAGGHAAPPHTTIS
jgi:EmrB/QacA subfamily drug resistance transporter